MQKVVIFSCASPPTRQKPSQARLPLPLLCLTVSSKSRVLSESACIDCLESGSFPPVTASSRTIFLCRISSLPPRVNKPDGMCHMQHNSDESSILFKSQVTCVQGGRYGYPNAPLQSICAPPSHDARQKEHSTLCQHSRHAEESEKIEQAFVARGAYHAAPRSHAALARRPLILLRQPVSMDDKTDKGADLICTIPVCRGCR